MLLPTPPKVVHVGSALDVGTCLVFRALCQEQLDLGTTWFVLDFSATEHMDATGLSAVFAIHREATVRGGGIALASVAGPVERVLATTQARAFARFETVAEAEQALGATVGGIPYTTLLAAFNQQSSRVPSA